MAEILQTFVGLHAEPASQEYYRQTVSEASKVLELGAGWSTKFTLTQPNVQYIRSVESDPSFRTAAP